MREQVAYTPDYSAAAAPSEPVTVEPSGQEETLPRHVTMPLLSLVTQQSMDEDYRHVAERRAGGHEPTPVEVSRGRVVATTAVVAVFGVLITIAALQTSRNADVTALGHASLVERIQAEKESVRTLQDRAGELRTENTMLESSLRILREDEQEVTARVRRLGARTGYLAVRGPGLRITVDDSPSGDQRVRDDDLLMLVDGLWAAGAEAIAINGQRLTVLSPLQNTGAAIHVNVRPLNPPYVVTAIGNPETLDARLLASTHGSVFFSVARTLGFGLEVEDDDDLELPAARVRPLRQAEPGLAGTNTNGKELAP